MNGIVYWIAVIAILGFSVLIVYGLCNIIARNIPKEDPEWYADEVSRIEQICLEITKATRDNHEIP